MMRTAIACSALPARRNHVPGRRGSARLASGVSLGSDAAQEMPMAADSAITFFYYDDIARIAPFYEQVLGFELLLDQGLARIYRVAGTGFFGIVDGNRGHLRHQPRSAVLLTIVDEDVAGWHARLKAACVPALSEIQNGTYCEHFFFEDPAGYAIEVQRFRDPAIAALFR
jgi:catechol 2,3-dioxygenase-like lactoylglutathione lyase family enzyme